MGARSERSVLRARHVRSRYLVARDHPAPERVRARLDATARSELHDCLRAALAGITSGDRSLWFIRRLDIVVPLDASWDTTRIATAWARQIAGAVRTALVHGPDGDGIVHFANDAEYLARFLVETAAGTAPSRWFFSRFAGLRALSASSIIRSAIDLEPDAAAAALASLTAGELTLVIETLSPADALRAAHALARERSVDATSARDDSMRALDAIRSSGRAHATAEERMVLRACIECARAGIHVTRAHVVTCRALVRLVVIRSGMPSPLGSALLDALATGAVAPVVRVTTTADAEVLAPLASAPRAWLASAAHSPETMRHGAVSSREPDAGPRETPFGGLFLLLPHLVGLRLDALMSGWTPCDGTPPGAIVNLLVALAAGSNSVQRDWYDAVARDVMAIPASLSVARAAEWSATIASDAWTRLVRDTQCEEIAAASDAGFLTLPTNLAGSAIAASAIATIGHELLRRFSAPLPGFSRSSALHLFVNFLDVHASLEDEPTRRVVRLGRAPLDLVLRMAGIGRGVFVLPWLDDRPFMLFPTTGT